VFIRSVLPICKLYKPATVDTNNYYSLFRRMPVKLYPYSSQWTF